MLDTTVVQKGNYHKGEQFYIGLENRKEQYAIKGINQEYWNDFESNSGKNESSLKQYKSAIRRFITTIDKDVLLISTGDLDEYLNNFEGITKENQSRYIKSFITYSIENNMNKALKYTNNDLIFNLIPNDYRILINILMNK